jgi:threonine/homoserine/homoserine lactone efflux protein
MMLTNGALLLKGIAIGFSIAAPVGPIGVLCIRRTLERGWRSGLLTGLGAACADAVYGAIASFGVTALSAVLVEQRVWLGLVGGAFLCYLGVRTLLARPPDSEEQPRVALAGDWGSTFFLTLTNPMTILAFAAIYAGLGIGSSQTNYAGAATMVAGVFTGSLLWWVVLSAAVSRLRHHIGDSTKLWINRASGVIIVGFGIAALIGAAT